MKSLASAAVLDETRQRLLRVTAGDIPHWGKMTATQMVGHLGCACEAALGERTVASVKIAVPPAVMKFMALRSGLRWAKNIQTTAEMKQGIAETPEGAFEVLRQVAIERIKSLASGAQLAPSHPFFGAMSVEDWLRWGYLHADHHLRQFGR